MMRLRSARLIGLIAAVAISFHPVKAQDMATPTTQAVDAKPTHTNRLSRETSPYLLQHAHNPVDWRPWGNEAFEAARAADKPIFLSIGYSTCYWCHVMERESFESEEIAAVMNEHFICIKVDREERPDVDDIYMAATQMLSGQGGWPMSVFLEPKSLKPFLAGTYFPPEDNFGRPGFPTVLKHIANLWQNDRATVTAQADNVADAVREQLAEAAKPVPLEKKHIENAVSLLLASYDKQDGGFINPPQRAPKFPTPANLDLLIGAAWSNPSAKAAVIHTLNRMATGGMYDQVGGGFHRYSTDEKWLVPHFEKMLYDNGQLASTYARTYELTKDAYYAEILRETLDYVLREMTAPEGGFYSAQDAEVNGEEGANYLWSQQEVRDALKAADWKGDIEFALEVYGLSEGTNFQDPHHPELPPTNVLYLIDRPDKVAASRSISLQDLNADLESINSALLKVRNQRQQPRLDDKILAGWNGLMIAGMADGGRVLNDKKYKEAASRAAQFVMSKMRSSDGGLLRSHREGQSKIDGFLEDYALMIKGLIAMHRATGDRKGLEDARQLADAAKSRFWDAGAGGFFDTRENQSDLFVRVRSSYDGAVPSGNSIMLLNLIDLHELTGQAGYLDDATATLQSLSSAIDQRPTMAVLSVLALKKFVDKYPHKLRGSAAAATAATTGPGEKPAARGKPASGGELTGPVQIIVNPKEIEVKPGAPATFDVTLTIDKKFHINANKPGDEYLVPLELKLTGGNGLKMSVEYPRGDEVKSEIAEGPIFQHHGTVTLKVTIEQTGKVTGRPQFSLTYQACTSRECQAPKTQLVGVRIISQK